MHDSALLRRPAGRTFKKLSRFPPLLPLTRKVRALAAFCVQLKAVSGRHPLYMVFYLLTLPEFAVRVGEKP